jgi:hypothetical protein
MDAACLNVLKEDCWAGLDFSAWDQLANWSNKAIVKNLETTGQSIKEVAGSVVKWIHSL